MSPHSNAGKPLGSVLQEAGLISSPQLAVSLQDQQYQPDLRLGEILALRGWLNQKTADFFAVEWPAILSEKQKHPLGHYLRAAGLLDESQVDALLIEQAQTGMRIGALAVLRGWLSQSTLDFFLQYLAPEHKGAPPFMIRSVSNAVKASTPDKSVKRKPSKHVEQTVYATQPVAVSETGDLSEEKERVDAEEDEIPWIMDRAI